MAEGKSEEKIRKFVEGELRKSGFPLETELSSFLEERDWFVVSSAFYADHDSGKEGEIDLIASKSLTSDSHARAFDPYELRLTLVIECKTSDEYHWVFFPRLRRDDMFEFDAGLIYTDFIHFARTRSFLPPAMFPSFGILPPTVAGTLIDTHRMRIAHPSHHKDCAVLVELHVPDSQREYLSDSASTLVKDQDESPVPWCRCRRG
jgi:hypothetical protein